MSEEIDYCSTPGAILLKARIEAYWDMRSLDGVRISVVPVEKTDMYSVKSNIAELLTVRMRNVYLAVDA